MLWLCLMRLVDSHKRILQGFAFILLPQLGMLYSSSHERSETTLNGTCYLNSKDHSLAKQHRRHECIVNLSRGDEIMKSYASHGRTPQAYQFMSSNYTLGYNEVREVGESSRR
ncbi:uncharacterized protein BCR38DRAFT_13663 [Pseudomassariella vexata]|uniref:Uncharacterized protein n=1 Tax=Pseudomassariella vexata TaxID=1141098 RepID=A0A1Y2EJ34_9PEZI|nr:uncharacterized protein BCR38DRAFT_13663 [Pseudomassariella vexata]ORY71592.1 hypothetical protein BCR38DRAFT_13663 [Pseudomassariella vexata]